MGWISMSERDLRRIEVLSEVRMGRRTVAASAAALLGLSTRQTRCLVVAAITLWNTVCLERANEQMAKPRQYDPV